AGESPWRRRPDGRLCFPSRRLLKPETRPAPQGEFDEHRPVRDELVALVHLHLAQADAAPAAPRHGVVAAVDQAAAVTLLEEAPDRVVVLLRHREVALALVRRPGPVRVGAVPVHPVAEADRLVRLDAGVLIDAGLAQ